MTIPTIWFGDNLYTLTGIESNKLKNPPHYIYIYFF
jgi:hypothetical protein